MSDKQYTVKDVHSWLDLSIVGLHRWCKRHAKALDPGANDPDGRQFSREDVVTLWTIKQYRDQGKLHKEIGERLANGERVKPDYMPDQAPAVPARVSNEVLALRQALAEANDHIEELEETVSSQATEIAVLRGKIETLRQTIKDLFRESTHADE